MALFLFQGRQVTDVATGALGFVDPNGYVALHLECLAKPRLCHRYEG